MEFDTNSPYNDPYSIFNQFDRIEFRPNHPLFQSELNGWQASADHQRKLLADFSINNGSIINGMGTNLIPDGANSSSNDNSNDNLFIWQNLHADNCQVSDSQSYVSDNGFTVLSNGTESNDYPDLKFSFDNPNTDRVTLSFDMANIGGNIGGMLHNIALVTSNGISVKSASINGRTLKDGELSDDKDEDMTDVQNTPFDLNRGNYNQVIITMDTSSVPNNTNTTLDLIFNYGYDPNANGCNVKLDHFMLEQGTEVTPWQPNQEHIPTSYTDRQDLLQVKSGFVYLNGYVRYFPGQSIPVTGNGAEKIGLKLTRQDIDSSEDYDLVDHTSGAESYGDSGADRDKYELNLTYGNEDNDAIILYLQNGHVVADASYSREIGLNNKLAQRTYEQSGSFLVSGMRILPHADNYNSDLIDLQFSPGVAYVMGHRIENDGTDTLPIPVVNSTYPRLSEPHKLIKNQIDSNHYRYEPIKLNDQPFKLTHNADTKTGGIAVKGVRPAKLSQISVNLNNDIDLSDAVTDNGYSSQSSISFDPNDTKHCYIMYGNHRVDPGSYTINGNTLHWNDNPTANNHQVQIKDGNSVDIYTELTTYFNGPSSEYADDNTQSDYQGGSFTTDYVIVKQGKTYYLDFNPQDVGKDITDTKNINMSQKNADSLIPNSYIEVSYYPYESREDLITLNYNGTFHDVQGNPAPADNVQPPINYNGDTTLTMPLGYVKIDANSQTATAIPYTTPRLPFTELNNMRDELKVLQANMDIIQGHEAAMAGVDPTTILDSFSDLFTDFSKSDISSDFFNVAFNPNGYITPGFKDEGTIPLSLVGRDNNISKVGSDIMEDQNDPVTYMDQSNWTDALQLNNFGNLVQQGVIMCDPDVMHYTDKTSTVLTNEDFENLSDYDAQMAIAKDGAGLSTNGDNSAVKNLAPQQKHEIMVEDNDTPSTNGRSFSNTTSITDYSQRKYMCSAWVHIFGTNFTPNATGFKLYIPSANNISLPLQGNAPKQSSIRNSDNPHNYDDGISGPNGTLNADDEGNISGWFLIPSRTIISGVHKVRVDNNAGDFAETTIDGTQTKPTKHDTINDVSINDKDMAQHEHMQDSNAINSLNVSFNQNLASLNNALDSDEAQESADFTNAENAITNDSNALQSEIESNSGYNQSMADSLSNQITDTQTDLSNLNNACESYNSETNDTLNSLSSGITNTHSEIAELGNMTLSQFNIHQDIVDSDVSSLSGQISNNASTIYSLNGNVNDAWDQIHDDYDNLQQVNSNVSADADTFTQAINDNAQNITNTANEANARYQQASNAVNDMQFNQQVDEANARNMFNEANANINKTKQEGRKAATFISNSVQTPRGLVWNIMNYNHRNEQSWCNQNHISPQLMNMIRGGHQGGEGYVIKDDQMRDLPTYWESRWKKNSDYRASQMGLGLIMGGMQIVPPNTNLHIWNGRHTSKAKVFSHICGRLGLIGICQPGVHPETEKYYKGRHHEWKQCSWTNIGNPVYGTVSFRKLFK